MGETFPLVDGNELESIISYYKKLTYEQIRW